MPAHSSGAAASSSRPSGMFSDEVLVDDDVVGVAAVGDRAVAVDRAVGLRVAGDAVLLVAGLAVLALAARVDHAADADAVARREPGDVRADLGDDAGDLVARDGRVGDLAPLAAREVDVGVADAAELDVDPDVLRPDGSTLDLQRAERCVGRLRADGAGGGRLGRSASREVVSVMPRTVDAAPARREGGCRAPPAG